MILDYLILDDAHARFFNGELCERYPHLVRGDRAGEENFIYLLLRIG